MSSETVVYRWPRRVVAVLNLGNIEVLSTGVIPQRLGVNTGPAWRSKLLP